MYKDLVNEISLKKYYNNFFPNFVSLTKISPTLPVDVKKTFILKSNNKNILPVIIEDDEAHEASV